MKLAYHPRAADELRRDARWYERRAPGTGHRFVALVEQRVSEIVDAPLSFPRVDGAREVRRAVLTSTFPHAIVFVVREDVVLVVAVAHAKRRPNYWLKRV